MYNQEYRITPVMENVIDEHLKTIKSMIIAKAYDFDSTDPSHIQKEQISPRHLLKAINEYAPGISIENVDKPPTFIYRFFELFPPITIVCFILTIAFGGFGIYALNNSGSGIQNGNSFIDIAKIFAGAIVGSTTSIAVKAYTNRRRRRMED